MVRGLVADGGHIEHIAAHIYVLCGDYAQAVEQCRRAVEADDKYLAHAGPVNFYTTARCHDLHLYMYTAMFLGQYGTALAAANRICTTATPELLASSYPFMASILDGYSAMRTHVYVRFGKWRELIEDRLPETPERTPIRVAMNRYGKGVAYSALGDIDKAETARAEFQGLLETIPEDAIFLSNQVRDILRVGEAMLEGELEYRKRNYERAFNALRLAVERDDNLNFTEPWAWMHPPRHALGALLAQQGRYEEAETVYRTDLGLHRRHRPVQPAPGQCVGAARIAGMREKKRRLERSATAPAKADDCPGKNGHCDTIVLLLPIGCGPEPRPVL